MQSLKKIGKEMPKIESEKPIYNVNQGLLLTHLQSQNTPLQYRLSYQVWRKSVKECQR